MSTYEPGNETPIDPEQLSAEPLRNQGPVQSEAGPNTDSWDATPSYGQASWEPAPTAQGQYSPYGPSAPQISYGSHDQFRHDQPGQQTAYMPYEQAATPPPAKPHRLRNGLIVAAMVLAAAGGGIAAGRAFTPATSSTSASSPAGSSPGRSSLLPGSGSNGSSGFPGFFGGSGGSSPAPGSSSGSGSSTGVGAGGGSLNAASLAVKVDPALVDINVVLGYQSESAAGTGIVLSSNGEVVTNNHVVDGATSIEVTDIGNGKTYAAKIVGTDATDDIAVIQLKNASGLATADLGNSSTLKVDEPVLAIGNAGGVGGTPSTAAGEVVALEQSITATDDSGANSENLTGLVETNAPIEPGDSGGPLVNSSGQVLAIDTAASSGNQFQSTSTEAYAIPIDRALSIAGQIESGQSSSTIHIGKAGMIGVEIEATGANGGSSEPGALIVAIIPGSPAASAGLVAGDVIVSLNGQTVDSPSTLSSLMNSHHPGDRVTIGYDKLSGQLHSLTLTLAAGPPA